jgi:mannitol/fructose-specific phosphotransferase system IIA component
MKFNLFKSKALPLLKEENMKWVKDPISIDEAIDLVGQMLAKSGYVEKEYIQSMHERNRELSVYIGNSLAIPHGTNEGKVHIKQSGISVALLKHGLEWGGEKAFVIIGIAGKNEEHMSILANLSTIFGDMDNVEALLKMDDVKEIHKFITTGERA